MGQNESLSLCIIHARLISFVTPLFLSLYSTNDCIVRQSLTLITSTRCNRDEPAYEELAEGLISGDRQERGEK